MNRNCPKLGRLAQKIFYIPYFSVGPQTQRRPLRKTLTRAFGLDDVSLAWPAAVQLMVFIYSVT